jgi:dipeptidyl aminopeptidase/acylaminoacyl peptidase
VENRPVPILLVPLLPLLFAVGPAAWQQPDTDVYLVQYDPSHVPAVAGPALNISNNPGYDNQPSFTPDGAAVLFSSNRDGAQTDVYRYDIRTRALTQLTRTAESEYSPLVTPSGSAFSVIRVEADGAQRLWQFDLDGTNPRVVLESIKPVGYHVWLDASRLGLFVLGAGNGPATLQIASTAEQTAETVASGIGRSLLMRPGTTTMSFISRAQSQPAVVMAFDPRTRTTTRIVDALEGSQDCAWDPRTGRLLMARGSAIFGWSPGETGWRELGDLSSAGLDRITRMAVAPDSGAGPLTLAVVAEASSR